MRQNERLIIHTVIATGVSSVVVQLLVIREYLTQFQGNEFVIALILFLWLLVGGLGTLAAYGLTGRFLRPRATALGYLSLLAVVLAAVQLFMVRGLRAFFFIPGVATGFYQTFLFIAATAAPYAFLIGFLLPFSYFVLRADQPAYPAAAIYITDNIGDVSGGALFSFGLIFFATPLQATFLANLPLFFFSWRLLEKKPKQRPFSYLALAVAAFLLVCGLVYETGSLASQTGRLAFYRESRYGRIIVVKNESQYTLFKDGQPVASSHNQALAEEAVHYPMAQLGDLKAPKVLLISIESGMLDTLRPYKPAAIDYVELDPAVSRALFRFGMLEKIEGLNVIEQDGRRFLTRSDRYYDAIIISLPEPDTFQVNRFYTSQFFELAKKRLNPGGMLSFSMQGYDNYLAEAQRRKLSVLYQTAKTQFKHVLLLPGQRIYFLCSDRVVQTDIPALLDQKGIASSYVSAFYHGNVTQERIEQLNGLIDTVAKTNNDFAPRLMRIMFDQWFARFDTSPFAFFILVAIFFGLYLWRLPRDGFVLFSTGFTIMGSEILTIFTVQTFLGHVYFQIGLIVTVFLAGLLPGAWLGQRLKGKTLQTLRLTDTGLILLMALFGVALMSIGGRLPALFFLAFGLTASLLCGFQFPLVIHLSGQSDSAVTRAFSADLMGAAAGTLITSVVLMPYLGIAGSLAALMVLKVVSFAAIALQRA